MRVRIQLSQSFPPRGTGRSNLVLLPIAGEGSTTDRRILFFLTESVWPAVEYRSEPATEEGLTTDRRILFFLTESVWPSSAIPSQR